MLLPLTTLTTTTVMTWLSGVSDVPAYLHQSATAHHYYAAVIISACRNRDSRVGCFVALALAKVARLKQGTKKRSENANTARHKFSPRRRPLPGGAGPPKFNQQEMVATCTYRPSLVKIDARNFELSW